MLTGPKIQATVPSPSRDCILEDGQQYTVPLMVKGERIFRIASEADLGLLEAANIITNGSILDVAAALDPPMSISMILDMRFYV